jgi:DNA-binding transcriptional ArsR family regulator
MSDARYIAVIGDVVGSRRAPDRAGLQDRLGAGLRDVNAGFAGEVAAEFVLTVGDEFQGLLGSALQLDKILATLRAHAFPAELRLGLGIGNLDTPLRPQALGMDGPCFHRAREAVERAAEHGTPIEVETGAQSAAMEIYALLMGHQRSRWTQRQREVVDLSTSGMEGQEIAAYLSISPSAVSQHLTAAGAAAFRQASAVWLNETIRLWEGK